ncbi:hypothetical protein NTE_00426 [Candidatus Nitrososphaera evergladensis SR1]|uniref:Uncharacterized protein n=1 Tax=Candidatus Nitrososphaera evergladensis SR1 TaxID=1459636 RepID=A0A075MMM5_9ARCH|nr:hypothetical protein [Candidatus Nitrososphaera evergladensis]AIF82508.1 hypothetical protein NTE_00426 [Candidatus Nitrososphaera evergladensis SR1]
MTHNGVDIVDFVLYTIYPTAAFFAIGIAAKKTGLRQLYVYLIQAFVCFAFSIAYIAFIPLGGGQGIAILLAMFGALLLFMARKQKVQPAEEEQKST